MRNILALCIILALAPGGAAQACNGRGEVQEAFVKQQKSPGWRAVTTSKSDRGLQEQTSDYVPPDKMYRKLVLPGQDAPIETIGIGTRAWNNTGSGWDELNVGYAQLVVEHIRQTLQTVPTPTAEYACLGQVAFEGKEYLGYQTAPEKLEGGAELARTIYVDPATGLPAFNIVGPPNAGGEPLTREAYSYPADLAVEKPY